jgi:predicted MPP superfamily phosphohydrolase
VREAVRAAGISLLTNEVAVASVGECKVAFIGYDYPWGTKDIRIAQPSENMVRIVASHNPDNIYRVAQCGAEIMLSGHTHGGQGRIPFFGSVFIPSVYGRRFDHGHFFVRGTHLFVSAGVGVAGPPVRIYCPPDVFVVEVRGA